eukprot:4425404-Karenia_brevis.AAC.1
MCALCGQEVEDEEHLFWRCPVAMASTCPEVRRTNHLASMALSEKDKKAKWLRGLQLAEETSGILQPWDTGEVEVRATPNLAGRRLEIREGYTAGTDASGGEHASDWRLRKVGWAFTVLDQENRCVGMASGNIQGKQSTNKGELFALCMLADMTDGNVKVAVDSAYV